MAKRKRVKVPAYVRLLDERHVSIRDLMGESGLSAEQVIELQEAALSRCVFELEQWRDYWQPIWQVVPGTGIEPIFRAITQVEKNAGDRWPLVDGVPDDESE
ncbi:MAG: hypothetical protein WED34_21205 [Planctomycetales bacterium]